MHKMTVFFEINNNNEKLLSKESHQLAHELESHNTSWNPQIITV